MHGTLYTSKLKKNKIWLRTLQC